MLAEPNCFKRNCKHFEGVKWFGEEESSERNFCKAFPDGIPSEISYGNNEHLKVYPEQDNDIVYERL